MKLVENGATSLDFLRPTRRYIPEDGTLLIEGLSVETVARDMYHRNFHLEISTSFIQVAKDVFCIF
jgi:hypothetical protein